MVRLFEPLNRLLPATISTLPSELLGDTPQYTLLKKDTAVFAVGLEVASTADIVNVMPAEIGVEYIYVRSTTGNPPMPWLIDCETLGLALLLLYVQARLTEFNI